LNTHAENEQENKSESFANEPTQSEGTTEATFQFVDNRPESIQMQQLQELANNSPRVAGIAQLQAMADNFTTQEQPIQRQENKTGLPDNLKSGMENLSGMSLDDVKVHRNSDKPAQLQAHAYAQGTNIHLGPGQEKHLPHELGHVVQQKQGRVKPTMQMKGKVNINDDAGLEKEADVMGAKAVQQKGENVQLLKKGGAGVIVQRAKKLIEVTKKTHRLYNNEGVGVAKVKEGAKFEVDEKDTNSNNQFRAYAFYDAIPLKKDEVIQNLPMYINKKSYENSTDEPDPEQIIEIKFMGAKLNVTSDGADLELPPLAEEELFSAGFDIPVFEAPVIPGGVVALNVGGKIGASVALGGGKVTITENTATLATTASITANAGVNASIGAGPGFPYVSLTAGPYIEIGAKGEIGGTTEIVFTKTRGKRLPEVSYKPLTISGTTELIAAAGGTGSVTIFFWKKALFKKEFKSWTLASKEFEISTNNPTSKTDVENRIKKDLITEKDLNKAQNWGNTSGQVKEVSPDEYANLPLDIVEQINNINYAWAAGEPEEDAYLAAYKRKKLQAPVNDE